VQKMTTGLDEPDQIPPIAIPVQCGEAS
jgi:hypothetical protein